MATQITGVRTVDLVGRILAVPYFLFLLMGAWWTLGTKGTWYIIPSMVGVLVYIAVSRRLAAQSDMRRFVCLGLIALSLTFPVMGLVVYNSMNAGHFGIVPDVIMIGIGLSMTLMFFFSTARVQTQITSDTQIHP